MSIIGTRRLTRQERFKRRMKILPRYFVHGILFAILMNVLAYLWGPFLAPLTQMPALLVLIVLGAVLFFLMGTLNALLTKYLWRLKMQFGLWTNFKHGLLFFIVFFVVYFGILVGLTFIWTFVGLSVDVGLTIIVIIFAAFVGGYVGRAVAGIWEEY